MDVLLTEGALQLARRIRSKDASPVEVVDAHIARIEAVNPHINAVVRPLFEQARADAQRKADALAGPTKGRDGLPPFWGVPFTIKEHMQVEGLPNTAGLYRRRDAVASEDAVLVQRMKDAGFVALGTTNVPEAMMWYETYNKVYGRTTNAYSVHRTPGGSSGGEGSIIGAAGSPIGLGGDVGGSIRNPAFFNGVVGHKASGGRVPETGAWPGVSGQLSRYKVLGPLARRVEDIMAVMPLLAGPDGRDRSVDGPQWGEAPEVSPRDVTVYWFDDNGVIAPSADMRAHVRHAVDALAAQGMQTVQWRPRLAPRTIQVWGAALEQAGSHAFNDTLGDFQPLELAKNWARWPLRRSEHIFPSLALATIERVLQRVPEQARQVADLRVELRAEIEARLGHRGVLIYPTFHRSAPRHGLHAVRHFPGFSYCAMINPLELPATAVPTGFGSDGLPLGVQVIGMRHHDHLTLEVARRIEMALGGWRPGPIEGAPALR